MENNNFFSDIEIEETEQSVLDKELDNNISEDLDSANIVPDKATV